MDKNNIFKTNVYKHKNIFSYVIIKQAKYV